MFPLSVFENSLQTSVRLALRDICTKFGQRSLLRFPHLTQISHKRDARLPESNFQTCSNGHPLFLDLAGIL